MTGPYRAAPQIRMHPELHAHVAALALQEDRSLRNMLQQLVIEALDARGIHIETPRRLVRARKTP